MAADDGLEVEQLRDLHALPFATSAGATHAILRVGIRPSTPLEPPMGGDMLPEDIRWEGRDRDPETDTLEGDEPEPEVGRKVDVGRQFLETTIQELKPKPVVSVSEDATVAKALELMRKKGLGVVAVVSKRKPKRLVGIFSERDLVQRALGLRAFGRVKISKVMTRSPEALRPRDSVAYALNKMSVGRFRHIPLVDEKHLPVSMISVRDIIDFLVELIPEEILNLPPEPQFQFVKTPEGD
jgi:CBS domain-containing protein